jgi:hypothetical protein
MYLCNLLGPLCTGHRFDDGSKISRYTGQGILYEHNGVQIGIVFDSPRPGEWEYRLPQDLQNVDRQRLIQKIEEYCRRKRYKLVSEQSHPTTTA